MTSLQKTITILFTALREIFDEAAYSRFLLRANMASSPEAYAAFWRERESTAPKPRCC